MFIDWVKRSSKKNLKLLVLSKEIITVLRKINIISKVFVYFFLYAQVNY